MTLSEIILEERKNYELNKKNSKRGTKNASFEILKRVYDTKERDSLMILLLKCSNVIDVIITILNSINTEDEEEIDNIIAREIFVGINSDEKIRRMEERIKESTIRRQVEILDFVSILESRIDSIPDTIHDDMLKTLSSLLPVIIKDSLR